MVISYEKPIFLKQIDGNMNSDQFIEWLQEFLVNEEKKLILCFDMAKFHTSNKRADINIIENIWSILKKEVFDVIEKKAGKELLYSQCYQIFFNSPKIKQSIRNCYHSLEKRVYQIIKKKGDLYKL